MDAAETLKYDYAKQLWALSSAIAAFSILQTLTYAYKFSDTEFRPQVAHIRHYIELAVVVGTFAYAAAIGWIERRQYQLVQPQGIEIRQVLIGVASIKLTVVVLCGAAALLLTHIAK